MSDDSSLTDFYEEENDVDAEAASGDAEAASGDDEPDADSRPSEDLTAASPNGGAATVTYEWSDDGIACADCGEPTRRRWRDDGAFVCAACKDW